MSQDLSARRQELMFMLGDTVEDELRKAEKSLAVALERYFEKDLAIQEWEEALRRRNIMLPSEFVDAKVKSERPQVQAELEHNLDLWVQTAGDRVMELRKILDMSPEERTALEQELDEIDARLAGERMLMNPATGSVNTERAWLSDFQEMSPEEWGGETFQDAGLVEVFRNIEGTPNFDPEAGEWRESDPYPSEKALLDRRNELLYMLHGDFTDELKAAEAELEFAAKYRRTLDADNIAQNSWIQSAQERVLELQAIVNMSPEERTALQQELEEIEIRLGIRPAPEHENQDNLMSLESRVSEIIHELDDNLDLGPDERAALEQELYGIQVKMERLEERANEIILELDDNLDLGPDERAALEQELREIEGKPGIMDASEEEGEQPSETASVQHDDTKPQWQPTTEEERRLVERYDELMYALHGMVEEDWHGLGTTYDALYEIDPNGDAARNTLKEMERLKKIMDMTPEERAALEAEAERIGAELKQREAEWRAGQEENPQQKSPFAASQKAQTAFVASLTETLQNLAKQGGNTLDLGAQNLPYSAISGQAFSGANATLLTLKAAEKGFADNRWMTFRQIESYRQDHPDVRIRAGEKGTTVLLPQQVSFIEKNGQREILSAEQVLELEIQRNKGVSVPEVKSGYLFAPYTVFNAQQIEGFPPKEVQAPGLSLQEKRDLVDRFVAAAGIKMDYTASPTLSRWDEKANRLIMSVPHLFQRVGNFISQKLHEAFHAFGHASRENSPHYASTTLKGRALAEMRAEMFSAVAGRYLGMEQNVSSMARRVDVWNRSFSDGDVQNLFHAAVDAGKMLSLLDQFAAGETPAAKWFPASETWEQSYHQAESNELKAALDWVGDALNGAWSDAPLNAALGAEIQQAIKADTPLAQLRDYLVEAWPYLAASPSLPVVNLANSYAKYLPDGVLEHERELVAATISGARRMQAVQGSTQVESSASAALLEQEQPVDKRQTLTDFDALTDPVERVRVLLRDPALLDEALKQDPKGVRELADLCDMVSQTLHMELDAAQQEQDLMNMPPASSPKKTERARM